MDEEQGLASPLAGGLQGIRSSVSSNVFTGRAVPPPAALDPQTTSLISQNSLALTTVSNQLANISQQVGSLNNSLSGLQQNLALNDELDRQREAAKQRREAILAEQALREGKESELENKIQTALISPVAKIAAKTQSILSQLANFFFTLLGGWLVNTTVEFLRILSDKNVEKFNEFKRKLGLDLLAIGGILLIATVGIKKLVTLGGALAANAFRITFGLVLKKPFDAVINFVRNLVIMSKNKVAKALGLLPEVTQQAAKKPNFLQRAFKNIFRGGSTVADEVTTTGGQKITGDVVQEGAKTGNRFTRFFKNLNPFKGPATEVSKEGAKTMSRNFFSRAFTPMVSILADLAIGEKLDRAIAGTVGYMGSSGAAAKILRPLKKKNPILYNVLVIGSGLVGDSYTKEFYDNILKMFVPEAQAGDMTSAPQINGDVTEVSKGAEIEGIQSNSKMGGAENITPVDNNRDMVEQKISSLDDPQPNIVTLPMGGATNQTGDDGGATSDTEPTTTVPNIKSSDLLNPYLSFSESMYGVFD